MKKQRLYTVETKADKVMIQAGSRDEAFAKFFVEVQEGKVPLENIGSIVILKDRGEDYPFRTAPLLYQLKLISGDVATSNIMAVTGCDQKTAEGLLLTMSFKDSRLIPLMDKVKSQ